jgi:polysaccharide export outer membrane protein
VILSCPLPEGHAQACLRFYEVGMKGTLVAPLVTLIVIATYASAQSTQNQLKPIETVQDFVIGPEDVLMINVWREPDFTTKAVVRPDGKISIALLDDIQAGGLTTKEVAERVTKALQKYLTEPIVTVVVAEIRSQSVNVIGAVARPGTYPIGSPLTIVQLLARAGGFTESAKPREIVIVRTEAGKTRRFRFNYDTFTTGENFQQNILLHGGDVIIIP